MWLRGILVVGYLLILGRGSQRFARSHFARLRGRGRGRDPAAAVDLVWSLTMARDGQAMTEPGDSRWRRWIARERISRDGSRFPTGGSVSVR